MADANADPEREKVVEDWIEEARVVGLYSAFWEGPYVACGEVGEKLNWGWKGPAEWMIGSVGSTPNVSI